MAAVDAVRDTASTNPSTQNTIPYKVCDRREDN